MHWNGSALKRPSKQTNISTGADLESDTCAFSNLIDISHTDEGSKTAADYARLFSETFPVSMLTQDSSSPPVTGAQDERTWLRNIIHNDLNDKTWDCNVVQEIHKPLTFTFD